VCGQHHRETFKDAYIREKYCENKDGLPFRGLNFTCTDTIRWLGQLHGDHIDGDPSNNDPKNRQTLCANCHAIKTRDCKDGQSPGRKARARLGTYHDDIKALKVLAQSINLSVELTYDDQGVFTGVDIQGYDWRRPADAYDVLMFVTNEIKGIDSELVCDK
jgi:hypothetical protein